jgi:hypothetical protein
MRQFARMIAISGAVSPVSAQEWLRRGLTVGRPWAGVAQGDAITDCDQHQKGAIPHLRVPVCAGLRSGGVMATCAAGSEWQLSRVQLGF